MPPADRIAGDLPDPGRDPWHALADALIAEAQRLACVAIDDAAEMARQELDAAIATADSHPPGQLSAWMLGAGIGTVAVALLLPRKR